MQENIAYPDNGGRLLPEQTNISWKIPVLIIIDLIYDFQVKKTSLK